MLHNMVHPHEQLPIDEISSHLEEPIFDFCESELFQETLQNSEVASSSNCCYEDQSSYLSHLSNTTDINHYNSTIDTELNPVSTTTGPTTPPAASVRNNDMSIMFDPTEDQLDNDISLDFTAPLSFSIPQYLNNQDTFNTSSLNNQISFDDVTDGSMHQTVNHVFGPQIQTGFDQDNCNLPYVPSYMHMRNCIDLMVANYLPSCGINAPFAAENLGIFGGGGLMLGNGITHQELDFQGDNGLFLPDTMPGVFNNELQSFGNESQHLVHGGTCGNPLGSEIPNLDDPTLKVGKLSVEERKKKIHRYMKKRNERNFSKKIKYACRKTLADSRPRVRGRFAKNDEQGDMARITGSNHEYDTDEDVGPYSNPIPDHQRKVGVKEEDLESADIFTQINSFKCSYPIQSWI